MGRSTGEADALSRSTFTMEVLEVRVTETGTTLKWRNKGKGFDGHDERNWDKQPTLVDTKTGVAYLPVTVDRGTKEHWMAEGYEVICICSGHGLFSETDPPRQVALYEPLPEGVTEVDIAYGKHTPVTVKVTR